MFQLRWAHALPVVIALGVSPLARADEFRVSAAASAEAGRGTRDGVAGQDGVAGADLCPRPFLTQSADPTAINGASSAVCQGGGVSAETSLAREFVAGPDGLLVTCVTFGVHVNVGATWPVDVRLLLGEIDGPYAALTLLAAQTKAIPANTSDTLFTVDFAGVAIPPNASLVVELRTPSRVVGQGGDGGFLALGCNSEGETAPTYIRAPLCGIPQFVPTALIGSPATNVVMTVGVTAATLCAGNDNCPPDALDEGEPCGTSTNGGPNGTPPGVTQVSCGETVCGTFYWQPPIRDTDWYEVSLPDCTCLEWRVWSDVALDVFIIDPATNTILDTATGTCPTVASACVPAGAYYLFVAPSFNNAPIVCQDLPNSRYVAQLSCTPCPRDPAKCCNEFGTGFMDPECAAIVCAINPGCCENCDEGCEQLAFLYCDCCRGCAMPPNDMVSWWTFDEPPAATSYADSAGGHTGTPVGGPPSTAGMVGSALSFNGSTQRVAVAGSSAHEFGPGAFSIDAWILWDGSNGGGILSYDQSSLPLGGQFGFGVTSNGGIQLALQDDCVRLCLASPANLIAANTWTHVAITASACTCIPMPQQMLECCDSNPSRVFTAYVNGTPVWSYSQPPQWCDITNAFGLSIGQGFCTGLFPGVIDEVQMFRRELQAGEIQTIYAAGSAGKCKHRCHIPWDRDFGPVSSPGSSSVTVPLTICNDSPIAAQFQIDIEPATPFSGCNGPSLTTFVIGGSNPVTVPGNSCVAVPITIPRPSGLDVGEVSCSRACVTNVATGVHVYCFGSVVRSDIEVSMPDPNCCIVAFPNPEDPGGVLPPPNVGDPMTLSFSLQQFGSGPMPVAYLIRVVPSDMHKSAVPVSLNRLPPGEPVAGALVLQPSTPTQLPLDVTFVAPAPFQFFDVIIAIDDDGDGTFVDTFSVGVASGPVPAPPPACPADLNADGVVDGGDLALVLGNWGQTSRKGSGDLVGDLTADGVVDGADLALLLGAWGPC